MKLLKMKDIQPYIENEQDIIKSVFDEDEINKKISYYVFLKEQANSLPFDRKVVYYTLYSWFAQIVEECRVLYGQDEGLEQQKFQLLEEMVRELEEGVDYDLLEQLDIPSGADYF
jgi:hypothetical protein